ncbi:MAG TPA: OmpH family outer membrane protein [Cyclobacteriaceae bacterium]
MKNLSIILNIVLLVAVGVLYFLHFSGKKSAGGSTTSSVAVGDLTVAYFNSDSVLKHYDYLEVNRKTLEEKSQKLEAELRNRAQGLQNEIANYQRNVNNLTFTQQKALEEDLGKKQQNLQLYEQSLNQQMNDEQAKLSKALYDRITAFLKGYGAEKGLQVVLKYDATSDVFYGNPGLDITNDVITGLNDAYKNEKTSGVKADSTATKK